MLLDLLPVGVLIYRLDRLLYANPAFLLERMGGYPNLHAWRTPGGLDALMLNPAFRTASSTSDTGTPVTISRPSGLIGTCAAVAHRRPAFHSRFHGTRIPGAGP